MKTALWLSSLCRDLDSLQDRGQMPHAIMLHGPAGIGRRWLAIRFAARLLGMPTELPDLATCSGARIEPGWVFAHPDLMIVQPPADKRLVPIDRVREMIDFLRLTSHQRGAKVVLLSPAQALTTQAANSLLKTLEEPPPGSYVVLVSDALSRLPSTLVSRCLRLRVGAPSAEAARRWLESLQPDAAWPRLLELAGGAPLLANEARLAGFGDQLEQMHEELELLATRAATPGQLARRWAKLDQEFCLRWLYQRLSRRIRELSVPDGLESAADKADMHLQNDGKSLNIGALFALLDDVRDARRLQGSGLNVELQLTDLLSRLFGAEPVT